MFREQLLAADPRRLNEPIIIDEVQKVPHLQEEYRESLRAYVRDYLKEDYDINFWRTKSGLEVDFVLARGEVAVEVKGSSRLDGSDLKPIKAFQKEYRPAKAIVVCNEQRSRLHEGVLITPWREFLAMLWNGAVVS